jgi:hypothetical protein
LDRIHDAGELRQDPVAHQLHDAAAVCGDFGVDHQGLVLFQGSQRPGLVFAHKPAVADYVGREYGGEPPLDAFLGHVDVRVMPRDILYDSAGDKES